MKFDKVHVYTGDGKGKTTAAVGLAVRAVGAGLRVLFVQFLKDCSSSELRVLKKLGIKCECFGEGILLRCARARDIELCEKGIEFVREAILSKKYALVVLDEVLTALKLGALRPDDVLGLIELRGAELVLTGRDAPKEIIEMADYASHIKKLKHPFDQGQNARKGIEF
ncbi:cob(I)yrinic acid a,c-diamide adenosyltransferase [Candidatus Woesearchaeota archaeon]|nr:MAG: cob(I)yrinic acid a,c-diamide adenosyltransferase [Candidatus Woesearchaeota archaeon]